jgi:hypothetical protein
MSKLLLSEHPLLVLPELAKKIGLNEAIVFQQIHYWTEINKKANQNLRDGYHWTYNSYEQWNEQFPFWHVNTIKKTIANLEKARLIVSGNYNKLKIDRTKWYRVDYKILEILETSPLYNICTTNVQEWYDQLPKIVRPLPETKPKINSKTNKSIGKNVFEIAQQLSFAEYLYKTNITDYETNIDAIEYYLKKYKRIKRKEHPKCTWQEWSDVAINIFENDVLDGIEESITDIIDRHFEKTFKQYNHDIRGFRKFINNDIYEARII